MLGYAIRRLGIALALTFPFWLTVLFLGDPDNGVIFASYIGSWLMAGAILAIGAALSATTKNQIIAFVLTAALVFVLIAAGTQAVIGVFQGWAPDGLVRAIVGASLFGHFTAITRGVLDLRDLFYFLSIIVAFLGAAALSLSLSAQTRGLRTIHGRVVDDVSGDPVRNARVGTADGPDAPATVTDADGRFALTAPLGDQRPLRVAKTGYVRQSAAYTDGTEIHLVNRLANEFAKEDKLVISLDESGCLCTTMFRISPQHLCWALENLVDENVVNRIRVPEDVKYWSRVALDRMLEVQ